jgi:hypothetical protein
VEVRIAPAGKGPAAASQDQAPQSLMLTPMPGRPGEFAGEMTPAAEGEYTLTLAGAADKANARFRVARSRHEYDNPRLDRDRLTRLASASGGKYYDLDDIDAVRLQLAADRRWIEKTREERLWDRPAVALSAAAAFVLFLGLEWFFRKRWDLK